MQARADEMNLPILREHAVVIVLNLRRELFQGLHAEPVNLWIAKRHQPRLHMLWRNTPADRVIDQSPCQIALADARSRPVDHLRRQYAANADLLAKTQEQHVDPGR